VEDIVDPNQDVVAYTNNLSRFATDISVSSIPCYSSLLDVLLLFPSFALPFAVPGFCCSRLLSGVHKLVHTNLARVCGAASVASWAKIVQGAFEREIILEFFPHFPSLLVRDRMAVK
jgi:hypothetical protein